MQAPKHGSVDDSSERSDVRAQNSEVHAEAAAMILHDDYMRLKTLAALGFSASAWRDALTPTAKATAQFNDLATTVNGMVVGRVESWKVREGAVADNIVTMTNPRVGYEDVVFQNNMRQCTHTQAQGMLAVAQVLMFIETWDALRHRPVPAPADLRSSGLNVVSGGILSKYGRYV